VSGYKKEEVRTRLRWLLFLRLVVASICLCFLLRSLAAAGSIAAGAPLWLVLVAYLFTFASAVILPRLRSLSVFATSQVAFDMCLVTASVAVSGGADSPLAQLYNFVILEAAFVPGVRGPVWAAAGASLAYTLVGSAGSGGLSALSGSLLLSFVGVAFGADFLSARLSRAEEELAANLESFGRLESLQQILIDTLDSGVIVSEGEGTIVSANATAGEILGRATRELVGQKVEAVLPGVPEGSEPIEVPIGKGERELEEGEGGQRIVRIKAAPITDTFHHPLGSVFILQDITAIRYMERRLKQEEEITRWTRRLNGPGKPPVVSTYEGIVGQSKAMQEIFTMAEKVARSDSTVLITGESGTGKELVARAIHARSERACGPFVAVNCGAIPSTLIESELFGHVRGAFTGAICDRPGIFRQANRGTVFLDEIAELPQHLQVRLLRVLQEKRVTPVGGSAPVEVDVRIIAATNRDLEKDVAGGAFRSDLYYRLNVIRISMPPLRERPEDIPLLIVHILRELASASGKKVEKISPKTMRILMSHRYPGNVRELENIIGHAVTLCEGDTLTEKDLPAYLQSEARGPAVEFPPPEVRPDQPVKAPFPLAAGETLDDRLACYEKDLLLEALNRAGGVRKRAAELLGIKYRSLRHRLAKYGLAQADEVGYRSGEGGLAGGLDD